MDKLTEQEIEKCLEEEEATAVYRMFTSKGVHLYMKIAKFYYNHYNVFIHTVIQIPLIIVDMIDSLEYWIKYKEQNK